jgi:hypothetical protein
MRLIFFFCKTRAEEEGAGEARVIHFCVYRTDVSDFPSFFSFFSLCFALWGFCASFFGGGEGLAAEDCGEQVMDEGGEGDGGAESRGPSPSLLFI